MNRAYTLANICDGIRVVFKINQAFCDLDPSQTEALSATHQICDFGVSIDNYTKCHHTHDGTPGVHNQVVLLRVLLNFVLMVKRIFFKYLNPPKRT